MAFAVGAVLAAVVLGGALYAAYPDGFRNTASNTSTASTFAPPPLLDTTTTTTITASVNNQTASQNATETSSWLDNSASNSTDTAEVAAPESFPSGY